MILCWENFMESLLSETLNFLYDTVYRIPIRRIFYWKGQSLAVSIWWIRRDLRLQDNMALHAALETGLPLVPLFIFDPALYPGSPEIRKNFLLDGLRALDRDLRERGSLLLVRSGKPLEILVAVLGEGEGGQIFAEEDYTPSAVIRDRAISAKLPVTFVQGNLRVPPGGLSAKNGQPFKVFTPFARAWRTLPVSAAFSGPAPEQLPPVLIAGEETPLLRGSVAFPAGELEAQKRLWAFLSYGIHAYRERRDYPALDGTSMLSPYLHFGMLSAHRTVQAAIETEMAAPDRFSSGGAVTWLTELIWREFYIHILFHHPEVQLQSQRPEMRAVPWRKAPGELEAWKYGQTGCPIVDAGMRQMLATGWMHNRVRMIAASFLVKDLLIDWREGERWFAKNLVDYDLAANNGGWQWTAGTGTDAAPYFRIFNPTLQGKKFDPQGDYVHRWLPELSGVPDRFIHEPWKLPAGSHPKGYPGLLVDHGFARERTLKAYRSARQKAGA